MKHLFTFAMLYVLAFSGCDKAAPDPPTDTQTSKPAEVKADAPPVPKVPVAFKPQTGSLVSPEEVPLLEQINRENVKVLAVTMPAMVRITANRQSDPHMNLFGQNIPFQFHFRPGGPRNFSLNDPSYGSGVIISKDGYIVTNDHVIEDAKDIEVQLQDKRSFPARVVAFDGPVDVAVLKIDATDLSALPWGDSDKVQVGEQVFALGNPFNLEDSASKGMVSATGRNLPDSVVEGPHYENFIQTDAAINPGNSGGALVNIHGELIGINTAIASTSGGSMGVGFAIPSNLVRYAVEGLLKDGRLVNGYLGVKLPESVDDGVNALFHLGSQQGALLAGVIPKSPADLSGLHPGDFITEVDGHKINNIADLRLVVAQIPIGKEVAINFIRNGAPQATTAKIASVPPELQAGLKPDEEYGNDNLPPSVPGQGQPGVENVLSGVQVSDLNDKSRQKFGVDNMVAAGVVVTGVQEGSPAESKGIERGDVIESVCVNRSSTSQLASAKNFTDVAGKLKLDESVVLLVHHGKASSFIYLAAPK